MNYRLCIIWLLYQPFNYYTLLNGLVQDSRFFFLYKKLPAPYWCRKYLTNLYAHYNSLVHHMHLNRYNRRIHSFAFSKTHIYFYYIMKFLTRSSKFSRFLINRSFPSLSISTSAGFNLQL